MVPGTEHSIGLSSILDLRCKRPISWMNSSFIGFAAPCSQSYEENLLGGFLFLLCIQTCLIFLLGRTSSLSIHILSLLQVLSQISCPFKSFLVELCQYLIVTFLLRWICIHWLAYDTISLWTFSLSHPTSPSHQIIKSQKSHLPFSFKFFKVLHRHELSLLLLFCFVFLGCVEKIECKYFSLQGGFGKGNEFFSG